MVVVQGRGRQLAAVETALGAVAAGRGRLLLVSGEAGIGKSLVAQAALDRADAAGLTTARGYAVDEPGAPALWPWRRLGRDVPALAAVLADVASVSGDDAGVAGDAAARFALCDAACLALAGGAPPNGLAVLLEDSHWADALSVAVLRHLVHDLAATRLLVVVTAREAQGSPFGQALPDLVRSPVAHQLPLNGLDVEAVARWLGADADTEAAGVLRFGPTGLAFTHALVRDAVAAGLSDHERATIHAGIAAAMERSDDVLLVGPSAVHWEHASGLEAARHCRDQARRAAALAARSLAPELATVFGRMAVRQARKLGAPQAGLAALLVEVARHE